MIRHERIYELIAASGGIRRVDIERKMRLSFGAVTHSCRVLAESGRIQCARNGKDVFWFKAGAARVSGLTEMQSRVLAYISDRPTGASAIQMVADLRVTYNSLRHTIRVLRDRNIISVVGCNQTALWALPERIESIKAAVEASRSPRTVKKTADAARSRARRRAEADKAEEWSESEAIRRIVPAMLCKAPSLPARWVFEWRG